jgi:two-component system, cell cycle sensor histidine kinase and response regulator CckA
LKWFQRRAHQSDDMAESAGTVLLVEDDEQVREFIRNLLTQNGFRVLEASTGAEGLRVAEEHTGEIDLLLSDMLLPELSGFDLALGLQRKHPQMHVLFITGYVEGEIVQKCVSELDASFLDKPFQPHVLLNRVREAVSASHRKAS